MLTQIRVVINSIGKEETLCQPGEVFMKFILFTLSILMLSNVSQAACSSAHATNFRRLMATLIEEAQYSGNQTRVQIRRGIPVSEIRPGSYSFSRLTPAYLVTKTFCTGGEDGQCESQEQEWILTKNCLSVDGVRVRILSSTGRDLRFDYAIEGGRKTSRYFLSGRTLNVAISSFSPSSIDVESFSGVGSR